MRRSDRKPTLSQRESDLIRFAADGHTDAQIAARLGISEATVGTYWGRVRVKIGPYSRTELVATVLRAQIDEELDSLHRENSRLVEALENSDSEIERLDQAILDDAPDAVILVDEGAVVRYANRF
ncbi:MAG TPA: helix-turn-helix transcriptional regulator, partial [Fimbriimonas sp.]|nr:helix-turn-helix transcriptional regulator [Fimbriimonas sp.]